MKRALLFVCFATCALAAIAGITLASAASSASAAQRFNVSTFQRFNASAPLGATPTPCASQYTCAVTPGATIVPGTVDTGNHCDDCTTNVNLPFPFALYGWSYTSVNLSSNGNAQFVSADPGFDSICLPAPKMGPTIFAYWDDLVTDGTNCTGGCGIYTSVSGSAPNRIFNIEWRTFYFSEPGNAYFEIRLHENTSSFDVILGQVNTAATATIGVQDGVSRFTQCVCNTQPPTNSLIAFSPGPCGTPPPTYTPTATQTLGTTPTEPLVTATHTPTSTITSTPLNTGTPTNTPFGSPFPSGTLPPTYTQDPNATSTPTPFCAFEFSDVQPSDYFYTAVYYMYCHGIISGYSDNTFRPYNNTTRGQLTKIVVNSVGWPLDCPQVGHFSDVPYNNFYYCYVETAYEHGIISGYSDGTFRWGNNVTRGQLCKIVALAMGWQQACTTQHFSDVPPSDPFYCYIETAYSQAIITGYADGTFRPGNPATRGQICVIVYRALGSP